MSVADTLAPVRSEQFAETPLGRGARSADPSPSTPLESLYIESVTVSR